VWPETITSLSSEVKLKSENQTAGRQIFSKKLKIFNGILCF